MIWAIDALRSGRPEAAARLLAFPPASADQSIGSRFAVHPWELETLLIQLFLTPKRTHSPAPTRCFDCSKFDSVADLVNRLRKLENVESAVYLSGANFNIFDELHRIAQRQFHWQRGYLNLPQFYRYAFIYAHGKCGEYFEKTYGLPITELNFVRFTLFAHSMRTPWISRTFTIPELDLTATDGARTAVAPHLHGPRARRNQQDHRRRECEARNADRRHIIFCPIQGLEAVLSLSTEDRFLATIMAAREEKYVGWELREIHRKEQEAVEKANTEPKEFPFELDELLPWWKRTNEFEEAK